MALNVVVWAVLSLKQHTPSLCTSLCSFVLDREHSCWRVRPQRVWTRLQAQQQEHAQRNPKIQHTRERRSLYTRPSWLRPCTNLLHLRAPAHTTVSRAATSAVTGGLLRSVR